jgi:hypothetical protein
MTETEFMARVERVGAGRLVATIRQKYRLAPLDLLVGNRRTQCAARAELFTVLKDTMLIRLFPTPTRTAKPNRAKSAFVRGFAPRARSANETNDSA